MTDTMNRSSYAGCSCGYCEYLRNGKSMPVGNQQQWREVADARERQERRAAAMEDEDLVSHTWRDRRRRVNDEMWLDSDTDRPEELSTRFIWNGQLWTMQPYKRRSSEWLWISLVVGASVASLLSLYVLSCGATLAGSCTP